jgi:hypothetical protein
MTRRKPNGKPNSIRLYRLSGPNKRFGLSVPQKMAAVKNVRWFGQVNLKAASGVQASGKPMAKLKMLALTRQ